MDKSKAIELLKQVLSEVTQLRTLRYDDPKFKLWRDKIKNILEAAFGMDSWEYRRFAQAVTLYWGRDDAERQEAYNSHLDSYETALKSITQKYKIPGIEEKPVVQEKEELARPIKIFDALKLHPRVVEASRNLFKDGYYSDAIFRAFTAVSNFVKEKSGLTLDGKTLMATVFSEEKPIIKINDLLNKSDRDEQEGFKFLFMGSQVGIRNPKAHDNVVQTDPYRTIEYLGLASLLMRRIEEGRLVKL